MPNATNFVYTDLSVKNALTLEVEGVDEFEVAQFSAAFAANEIPTAAVMLAIGRDARTNELAALHRSGRLLKQMTKAFVWFEPRGEYAPGVDWPAGRRKIFEGYFTGFAYRKIAGKVHAVANLAHWLAALGFSSALTRNGHVSNPSALNAAAVISSLANPGAGRGHYISQLAPAELVTARVETDLWAGIKSVFCALSQIKTMPAGPDNSCTGTGDATVNDVAQYALGKIEGPSTGCALPYTYGAPLKLNTLGIDLVAEAVASAVSKEMIEGYAATSFWDKLVGQFCPMFGMAVVPMVDSAVVAADTPAYAKSYWREITTDTYDSYDMTRELHRPLRAVGVAPTFAGQTRAGVAAQGEQLSLIGGCYVEDSVQPGDGMVLYVPSPPWLELVQATPSHVLGTSGLGENAAVRSATTTASVGRSDATQPDTVGTQVNELYRRYAQAVYVNQMLRGQGGSFSGKLRFDIAPLSIVRLRATSEKFIGAGQDDLAETLVGCVQRVTVSINAEAGLAGTTFQMSHTRTEAENKLPRTSVADHPLFLNSIHGGGNHGSPLVADYEFPEQLPVAPAPRPVGG